MNDVPDLRMTNRQLHVVSLLAKGLRDEEIGTRLGISKRTVRFHIDAVKRHWRVKNRVELMARVIQHLWLFGPTGKVGVWTLINELKELGSKPMEAHHLARWLEHRYADLLAVLEGTSDVDA